MEEQNKIIKKEKYHTYIYIKLCIFYNIEEKYYVYIYTIYDVVYKHKGGLVVYIQYLSFLWNIYRCTFYTMCIYSMYVDEFCIIRVFYIVERCMYMERGLNSSGWWFVI